MEQHRFHIPLKYRCDSGFPAWASGADYTGTCVCQGGTMGCQWTPHILKGSIKGHTVFPSTHRGCVG